MSDPVSFMTETLALVDAHDLDACLTRLPADFRMHLAGMDEPLIGREAWLGNTSYLLGAFPDLRVSVVDAFAAADDRVVVLARLSGTHHGDFLGRAATGRHATWDSYEIYRVRDGLVTEEWICSDLHALLEQVSA